MVEHVHGCLNCRPDMVPDFSKDDPRYHDGDKCNGPLAVTVDGKPTGYTRGVFEGPDGWVLAASRTLDTAKVHVCPNCTTYHDYEGYPVVDRHEVCVESLFGVVAVTHECPVKTVAENDRLKAALKPLVPEAVYWRAVFGRDVY